MASNNFDFIVASVNLNRCKGHIPRLRRDRFSNYQVFLIVLWVAAQKKLPAIIRTVFFTDRLRTLDHVVKLNFASIIEV
jgi:hypothetical protein